MAQDYTNTSLTADNTAPAFGAIAVTPSDSTNLTGGPCRGLWVGGAGNINVIMANNGASVTFVGVPAGTIMPLAVLRVNAASTTATSIVALY